MRHDLADKLLRAFFFDPRDGVLYDSAQRGQKATPEAGVTVLSPFGVDIPRTANIEVDVDNDRGMPFEFQKEVNDYDTSMFFHFRFDGGESAVEFTLSGNSSDSNTAVYTLDQADGGITEDGADHTILVTVSRGDGLDLYLDGNLIGSDSGVGSANEQNCHLVRYQSNINTWEARTYHNGTSANLKNIRIGGTHQTSTDDQWDGPIYAALYWHHKLGAADAKWLHHNYRKLRESLSVRRPRFALTDMPADVRLLTAPKPIVKQPPAGQGRPKVDFILAYGRSIEALGHSPNMGRDKNAIQNDAGMLGISAISTPYGQGWSFDGQDGPDFGAPYMNTSEGFTALTVGTWVRCTDITDDQHVASVWAGTSDPNSAWRLELDTDGANLNPRMQSAADNDVNEGILATSVVVSDGEWHHVVAVWVLNTATNVVEGVLYTDGIEVGSYTAVNTGWNTAASGEFRVTSRSGTPAEQMNGDLVGFFATRQAWTAMEVNAAYQNHWGSLFEPQSIYATYPYVPAELGGPDGRDRLYTFKRFQ